MRKIVTAIVVVVFISFVSNVFGQEPEKVNDEKVKGNIPTFSAIIEDTGEFLRGRIETDTIFKNIKIPANSELVFCNNVLKSIKSADKDNEIEIQGIKFKIGSYTYVYLYDNGNVRRGIVVGKVVYKNIEIAPSTEVGFYKNTNLKYCKLDGSQKINGIEYKNNTYISFNQEGKVLEGTELGENIGNKMYSFLARNQTLVDLDSLLINVEKDCDLVLHNYPEVSGFKASDIPYKNLVIKINHNQDERKFVFPYSNGELENAFLAQNALIKGGKTEYELLKGTPIALFANGYLRSGYLAKPKTISGIKLNTTRIERDTFPGGIGDWFSLYEDGEIERIVFDRDFDKDNIKGEGMANKEFDKRDLNTVSTKEYEKFELSKDKAFEKWKLNTLTIKDKTKQLKIHPNQYRSSLGFFNDGMIKFASFAAKQKISSGFYAPEQIEIENFISFDTSGKIKICQLSEDTNIKEIIYKKGQTVSFDDNGNVADENFLKTDNAWTPFVNNQNTFLYNTNGSIKFEFKIGSADSGIESVFKPSIKFKNYNKITAKIKGYFYRAGFCNFKLAFIKNGKIGQNSSEDFVLNEWDNLHGEFRIIDIENKADIVSGNMVPGKWYNLEIDMEQMINESGINLGWDDSIYKVILMTHTYTPGEIEITDINFQ